MSNNKIYKQVNNILNTLLEATDHFSNLIKEKNKIQSVHMFTSIVEGTQSVFNSLEENNPLFYENSDSIIKSLTLISNHIEEDRFTKTLEVIQFSLRPAYSKMKKEISILMPETKKYITMRIYHRIHNPLNILRKERLDATLAEAKKQNVNLYFFTSEDINIDDREINALVHVNGDVITETIKLPDVISNIGLGELNNKERQLYKLVPFLNTSNVGNKLTLPMELMKYKEYAELLVPFIICTSESKVYSFLEKHEHAVFKSIAGNRGENIYFVRKKGSRYIVLEQTKERIMTEELFSVFLEKIIFKNKGNYILQRYIHTKTKQDEPYHFRSLVQKIIKVLGKLLISMQALEIKGLI